MIAQQNKIVRILLVEDDVAQARLLSQILRHNLKQQVQLETITDPLEAHRYIQNEWVDILVTDISMPMITGLDLLKCAKSRNSCAQVIMLTASSTIDNLVTAMELGAVDYLLKPVDQSLLVALVNQAEERLARWRTSLSGTFERLRNSGFGVKT